MFYSEKFNTLLAVTLFTQPASSGLIGLASKLPPQLGHTLRNSFSTQRLQKVHS